MRRLRKETVSAPALKRWPGHAYKLIPYIAVTIEPGVYLPAFGVRSEIDVFITPTGPRITTEPQREIVRIP